MGGQDFEGLERVDGKCDIEARFTRKPDLEAAKQMFKSLGVTDGEMNITLIETQQEYGRVYEVSMPENEAPLILRINLPVEPRFKTLSEVATMEWVQKNTNIPVPKVIHYDASKANPIGFEYILMTKLPGKPLSEVGPIVAHDFFWHDNIHLDVPRGPFSSAGEWLKAILLIKEHGARLIIVKYSGDAVIDSDDEFYLDKAQTALKIIDGVRPLIGKILPSNTLEAEPSMLLHQYLSVHNILVDDSGALTGIIDWQCIAAVPVWSACCYPRFLNFSWRENKPEREGYWAEDDGEPNELYRHHMEEYECHLLRSIFLEEMERLEPGWVGTFNKSELKVDLEEAVVNCVSEVGFIVSRNRELLEWIDKVNAEKPWEKKAEGLMVEQSEA